MLSFRKYIIQSVLFVCCYMLHLSSAAQQKAFAKASLQNSSIEIGQQVELTISVSLPDSSKLLSWPKFVDTSQKIEVIELSKIDTLSSSNLNTLQQKIVLTSFEPGNSAVPPMKFIVASQGLLDTIYTNSISLQVNTVAVDTTKPFKDIKDIADVEEPSMYRQIVEYLKSHSWIIWAVLTLVALALGLVVYFRKKRSTSLGGAKLPPELPHEKAFRQLKELQAAQLWQKDRIKEYYSTLSDIIRVYLEERYKINAPEQTTDELLALARSNREVKKVRTELKRLLRTADLVKFAKAHPLPNEHTACMDAAQEIVRRTMQKEEVQHD
jgi:hypothetical protein